VNFPSGVRAEPGRKPISVLTDQASNNAFRLDTCRALKSCQKTFIDETSSSAIAERPRCRMGQFCPKVEDDILQTVYRSIFNHCDVISLQSYQIR